MIIKQKVPNNDDKLEANAFKTIIQKQIVKDQVELKHILGTMFTGFGKTYTTMDCIRELRKIKPDLSVLIIVPTIILKEDFEKKLAEHFLFMNYSVQVINSIVLNNDNHYNYDYLIVDECHNVLNENAEYFSLAIQKVTFTYSMFLSASLKPEMRRFLDSLLLGKGISSLYNYDLTLYWGKKNGLLPEFQIYSIPLELTSDEKFTLLEYNSVIKKYQSYFAQFGVYHPFAEFNMNAIASSLGFNVGQVFGMKNKWIGAYNKRKELLQNSEAKQIALLSIAGLIQEQCLVYHNKIDTITELANKIPNSKIYHSKLKKHEKDEVLKHFYNTKDCKLFSIDTLKEGVNIESCSLAIRMSYNSNSKDLIQQLGRVLRITEDMDKEAILINFVVNDFMLRGQLVESQEKKWLLNSITGQNNKFITLNELQTILTNRIT